MPDKLSLFLMVAKKDKAASFNKHGRLWVK